MNWDFIRPYALYISEQIKTAFKLNICVHLGHCFSCDNFQHLARIARHANTNVSTYKY